MRYKKPNGVGFVLMVGLMLSILAACSSSRRISGTWESTWEEQEFVWYASDGRRTDVDYFWDSQVYTFSGKKFTYIHRVKDYENTLSKSVYSEYTFVEEGSDKDGDYRIRQLEQEGTFSLTDNEIELTFADGKITVKTFSHTENTIKIDNIRYTRKNDDITTTTKTPTPAVDSESEKAESAAHPQEIIGKWLVTDMKDTTPEEMQDGSYGLNYALIGYLEYEFRADGTGVMQINMEYEGGEFSHSAAINSWIGENGALTMTVKDEEENEDTYVYEYRISDSTLILSMGNVETTLTRID